MQICISHNYPKSLVTALKLIHSIDINNKFHFFWGKKLSSKDSTNTVVLLFDRGKSGLDVPTKKYFEAGFKVIALKASSVEYLDAFELSLTVLNLWPKVLDAIKVEEKPFVYTYGFKAKKLNKVTR